MSRPTRLDWGHAYEHTQRETARALRDERARGVVTHAFGDGGPGNLAPCDPSRMSDGQIARAARLHAERVVNRGIAQEVERRRRRGQPLDGMIDEV